MLAKQPNPLVTVALFAYNQEPYIEQAVRSVLAQDYAPLEIILSDDGSGDRTFELMSSVVARYGGPHTVVLNRMSANGGFANHLNTVFKMAKGELIVVAAGDDVSLPNRVSELVSAWSAGERRCGVVYSNIDTIDRASRVTQKAIHNDFSRKDLDAFLAQPFALICSYAFSAAVWKRFPPLNADLVNEDFIVALRALLASEGIRYVDNSLVHYRVDDGVGHAQGWRRPRSRRDYVGFYQHKVSLWRQIISDLKYVGAESRHVEMATASMSLAHDMKAFCEGSPVRAVAIFLRLRVGFIGKLRFLIRYGFPRVHRRLKAVL